MSRIRRVAKENGWYWTRVEMAFGSGWPRRFDQYEHPNHPGVVLEVWRAFILGYVTRLHFRRPDGLSGGQRGGTVTTDEALELLTPRVGE